MAMGDWSNAVADTPFDQSNWVHCYTVAAQAALMDLMRERRVVEGEDGFAAGQWGGFCLWKCLSCLVVEVGEAAEAAEAAEAIETIEHGSEVAAVALAAAVDVVQAVGSCSEPVEHLDGLLQTSQLLDHCLILMSLQRELSD
jgi:hypothetical protein